MAVPKQLIQLRVIQPEPRPNRVDLFAKLPWLGKLFKMRSFPAILIIPNMIMFVIFLAAGIFGSPVGSRNIMVVFIWILWWFGLIAVLVPFGSRSWCTMCPLPFFGDWVQRRTLIKVNTGSSIGTRNQLYGRLLRWPKKLSNIWVQNIGFLCLATFSAHLVTRPMATVLMLGGLIVVAAVMGFIWKQRVFCNYVCPVGGFLSLYSMTAMVELRSADKNVCRKCTSKACAAGSDKGWACPWFIYMGALERNNYCGMCTECVKSCPHDNIKLYWRPFCSDTVLKGYDELHDAYEETLAAWNLLESEHQNTVEGYQRLQAIYESTLATYTQVSDDAQSTHVRLGEALAIVSELAEELGAVRGRLAAVETSTSWKLTRPLRAVRHPHKS